jgi:hypothetical protein
VKSSYSPTGLPLRPRKRFCRRTLAEWLAGRIGGCPLNVIRSGIV